MLLSTEGSGIHVLSQYLFVYVYVCVSGVHVTLVN